MSLEPDPVSIPNPLSTTPAIPSANVREDRSLRSWFSSKLWWLTLICLAVSLGLFWYSRAQSGELITIEFRNGHGLKPEDRVKVYGIDIGAIEKVELNKTFDGVVAHIRLTPQARSMAAEGAKFWIVRPLLSMDAVRGLDTIVGAKYIAIEPGHAGGRLQNHFEGLETPPIEGPSEGALEITLDANTRGGLENGAPILFRGFRIGKVLQVGLASDARTVRARCAIDAEYRDLVRRNSKFWNRSGWRLDIGFSGVKLDADTLAQILSGGIEMATPTEAESSVNTGHRFVLYDKPESEWTEWKPSLAHGANWDRMEAKMPQPIRMALRWQERSFGFRKNHQRFGWCLPMSDGSMLCLAEQITAPKSALTGSIILELLGASLVPDQWTVQAGSGPSESLQSMVRFVTKDALPGEILRWPVDALDVRLPDAPCDALVAHGDGLESIAIDAARWKPSEGVWELDDQVALVQDQSGLPVVSTNTGHVIGMLNISKKRRVLVNR